MHMLALSAAFSFVIMMFNLPVPGGSTGHAVGGAIIGIVIGPWAAVISISVALVLQALIFGDGGITAIGANCFNIAVVMPFSAYYLYLIFGFVEALVTVLIFAYIRKTDPSLLMSSKAASKSGHIQKASSV